MSLHKDVRWKSQAKQALKAGPYSIQNDKHQTKERKERAQKFYEKNGFHYEETWSLDHSFACWAVPRLAFLRDNHHGYPGCLITEYDEKGNPANDDGDKKWVAILDEMIEGFLLYAEDCCPTEKDKIKKVDRALELFKEYFYALWD